MGFGMVGWSGGGEGNVGLGISAMEVWNEGVSVGEVWGGV
jgi:hypothetical protein